jgi:hypothetical protein
MSTAPLPPNDAGDIFPPVGRYPYYIDVPFYTRYSAGIKSLHLLCHALNRIGQNAFVRVRTKLPFGAPVCSPDLLTPRLTQDVIDQHYRRGQCPIVIYLEDVTGNPFRAPLVVRYVLNFPGLIGGEKVYADSEIRFGYFRVLAEAAGAPENVLYLPASDSRVFYPPADESRRSGACYYVCKFKRELASLVRERTRGMTEITREQTPEELADLLRRSEVLYCFENSAIATEAGLCGCPTIFVPNEYMTDIIAREELGVDGVAWGENPEEVDRAFRTVGKVWENYQRTVREFWQQLVHFVAVTQEAAARTPYTAPVRARVPGRTGDLIYRTMFPHIASFLNVIIRARGGAALKLPPF